MVKLKLLFWVLLWSFLGGSIGMDLMVFSVVGLKDVVTTLLLGPILMVSFGLLGWLGGAVGVWLWMVTNGETDDTKSKAPGS